MCFWKIMTDAILESLLLAQFISLRSHFAFFISGLQQEISGLKKCMNII